MSTSGETRSQGFAKVGKPKKPEKQTNMSAHDTRNQRFMSDMEEHKNMVEQFNDSNKKKQMNEPCDEEEK